MGAIPGTWDSLTNGIAIDCGISVRFSSHPAEIECKKNVPVMRGLGVPAGGSTGHYIVAQCCDLMCGSSTHLYVKFLKESSTNWYTSRIPVN